MVSDVEKLPITEHRFPSGYIHLIYGNDRVENLTEDGFEHIVFPNKSLGNVGQAHVLLTKGINTTESSEKIYLFLSPDGITPTSSKDVDAMGLYALEISLKNKNARFRSSLFSVNISIDGREEVIEGSLDNEPEAIEQWKKYRGNFIEVEGSHFTTALWTTPKNIESYYLYITYDPENPEDRQFLQDLYFKFSVVHPPQGGVS